MGDGQLVPVCTVGVVHVLVDGAATAPAEDWLLAPALPELRASLAVRLLECMTASDGVRLLLPPIGPVRSRARLEALYAAVQDVDDHPRSEPFLVELVPQEGEAGAAIDVLLSLTQVRGTARPVDTGRERPRVRLPTDAESLALGVSTGKSITALSGAAATSAAGAWLGGGALSTGGASLAGGALATVGGAGLVGGPGLGLLAMAGPVGLVGAAGAVAYGLFGRKKRDAALEQKLAEVEQDWRERVEAAEQVIEAQHRQEVEALLARIAELEATVAEQTLALSELSGRTGTARTGPELAQPIAFAVALAGDPGEPLQRRENMKYAWRLLVRYIGALMLAELEQSGRCTPDAAGAIQAALRDSSGEGRWLHLCRAVAELTAGEGSFFAAPLSLWRRKKKGYGTLLAALDRIKESRNDAEHGSRIPSAAAAQRWLDAITPQWERALEEARPYTQCRLFIVESLIDHTEDGLWIYQVRWLVGDRLYPRAERCAWPIHVKRDRLYALRAGVIRPETRDDVLDVSTFLRWEHSSVLDRPETYGVVGLGEDALQFGAFRFQDEKALGGAVPEWLAAK